MFNSSLKKEALKIHENSSIRYQSSYQKMNDSCTALYEVRVKSGEIIQFIENVINSIANTPKEISTDMGSIITEMNTFRETEAYAMEAFNAAKKAGKNIAGGAAAGMGIAAMAPSALMSIATTFGTASTGTAISALSGAAAQKAAVAWIGRTFAGVAVKQGAGMAAGKAFLALAGPVGWGISAASIGASLGSLTKKNKDLADEIITEAKELESARESLDETTERIDALKIKTDLIKKGLESQKDTIFKMANADYLQLSVEKRRFLGTVVKNTYSLSKLMNETIE